MIRESLTREEIENLPHITEVTVGKFYAGNPAKVVEGLICKVNNGLGSKDYYVPDGHGKYVWVHRN